MWKCHHCKTPHMWKWEGKGKGGCTASQKAIKICDHLFPLLRLIHLSGEWFCPYPPKATNLFCCLSPCIRMNLWNSQTCSPSLLPLPLSLVGSASFSDLFLFISSPTHSPGLGLAPRLAVLTLPLRGTCSSSLSSSLRFTVSEMSTQIQFKSYPEKREQQQDFVNGNLIRGEQGVCNAVHVPGSCLIAFGFVQIWRLLSYRERKITQTETADSFFTMYFNFLSCSFFHISEFFSSKRNVYLSFDWFVLLKERMYMHREVGAWYFLPSLLP